MVKYDHIRKCRSCGHGIAKATDIKNEVSWVHLRIGEVGTHSTCPTSYAEPEN